MSGGRRNCGLAGLLSGARGGGGGSLVLSGRRYRQARAAGRRGRRCRGLPVLRATGTRRVAAPVCGPASAAPPGARPAGPASRAPTRGAVHGLRPDLPRHARTHRPTPHQPGSPDAAVRTRRIRGPCHLPGGRCALVRSSVAQCPDFRGARLGAEKVAIVLAAREAAPCWIVPACQGSNSGGCRTTPRKKCSRSAQTVRGAAYARILAQAHGNPLALLELPAVSASKPSAKSGFPSYPSG